MNTLQQHLRDLYVSHGISHIQKAADRIDADAERIKELEAENAALRKDAERLNAVDCGWWFCEPQMDEVKPSWRVGKVNNKGQPAHQGKTLRAAIDAARSKT